MIASSGTLGEFFRGKYLAEVTLRESTAYQYGRAVADFEAWHGGSIAWSELTSDLLNQWIMERAKSLAPKTVKNRRNAILAVWRQAAEVGLVKPPWRIRRVSVPAPIPVAWSLDELRRLVSACVKLPPVLRIYMRVLILVAYQTGLRRSDLFAITADDFDETGCMRALQRKTQTGHVVRIDQRTLADLRALGSLEWPLTCRSLYRWMKKLCDLAGVPYAAIQQLRRTGATYVERDHPGAAMRYLGHRTHGLAYRHYVDTSKLDDAVRPPEL